MGKRGGKKGEEAEGEAKEGKGGREKEWGGRKEGVGKGGGPGEDWRRRGLPLEVDFETRLILGGFWIDLMAPQLPFGSGF